MAAVSAFGAVACNMGLTDQQALQDRQACKFHAGDLPEKTLAADWPKGDKIPIDHIVLIMQENRSFDHYFSGLSHDGVDVASPTATNPAPDGTPIQRFHATGAYCISSDVDHEWDAVRQQFDNGRMDGFAVTNATMDDPTGHRAMGYMDETDLPFYYSLARTFAISDRHFCSAPGDTAPNREYFAAASSRGAVDSSIVALPQAGPDGQALLNIYALVDGAGISWKYYSAGVTPQFGSLGATDNDWATANFTKFLSIEQFYADAKAGNLPSVSYVDQATNDSTTCLSNEHPTEDPQLGQKFIENVVKAMMGSPQWESSALFVTWDEHGGFYDHVYPPHACIPDDYPPMAEINMSMVRMQGNFDIYGPRVPLLVVSPYAKRGHVSHHVTDHTSILRFVEARFNLPALTNRDANAEPPFDMFDFDHPDFSIPTLAPAVVDDPTQHGCGPLSPNCTFY
jgi:phospholipase C